MKTCLHQIIPKIQIGLPPFSLTPGQAVLVAICRSNATGLRYPRVECIRSRLYQPSIHATTALFASARVCHRASCTSSVTGVLRLVHEGRLSQKNKDRQVTRPASGGTQDLSKRMLLDSFKLYRLLTAPKETF